MLGFLFDPVKQHYHIYIYDMMIFDIYIYICMYICIHTHKCMYFVSQYWFDAREIIYGSSILKKAKKACTGHPFAESSIHRLGRKGIRNELTSKLRGWHRRLLGPIFFFQGFNKPISTKDWSWGWNKIQLWVKIMWEFLGESPTWQSLGHIYRHGPEFLLVTHVWVCRTLACPPHVDVCMLTNGATPRVAGRQRWRSKSWDQGFPFVSRPGLSSFCNDAFGW